MNPHIRTLLIVPIASLQARTPFERSARRERKSSGVCKHAANVIAATGEVFPPVSKRIQIEFRSNQNEVHRPSDAHEEQLHTDVRCEPTQEVRQARPTTAARRRGDRVRQGELGDQGLHPDRSEDRRFVSVSGMLLVGSCGFVALLLQLAVFSLLHIRHYQTLIATSCPPVEVRCIDEVANLIECLIANEYDSTNCAKEVLSAKRCKERELVSFDKLITNGQST